MLILSAQDSVSVLVAVIVFYLIHQLHCQVIVSASHLEEILRPQITYLLLSRELLDQRIVGRLLLLLDLNRLAHFQRVRVLVLLPESVIVVFVL